MRLKGVTKQIGFQINNRHLKLIDYLIMEGDYRTRSLFIADAIRDKLEVLNQKGRFKDVSFK